MAKNDFQYAGRPPSLIVKNHIFSYCRDIRWSLAITIQIFSHLTVIEFKICCCVPNFIKIGSFSLKYGDLTILKMVAVRHLLFSKFGVYVNGPVLPCHSVSPSKILLKSENTVLSCGQNDLQYGGRPPS